MDSEFYFKSNLKRKTLDSPTDEYFNIDVDMSTEFQDNGMKSVESLESKDKTVDNTSFESNVQDTTRVDPVDSGEFYYKLDFSNNKSQSSLSMQFLSNFMTEFTDEELAAKRTVETIYSASGSFAYTYRSLVDAFFSKSEDFATLMPFVKALASVADETFLYKMVEGKNVTDQSSVDKSLVLNFELIILGFFRPIKSKLGDFLNLKFPLSWKELNEFITLLFKNGVLSDLYTYFSNIYGIYEIYMDDFKRYLVDFRLHLTQIYDFLAPADNKQKKLKTSDTYSLLNCVDIVNFLLTQLDNMRKMYVLFSKSVINTPVTDKLESVLSALERDMVSEGLLLSGDGEVCDKVGCVRVLMEEESVRFLCTFSAFSESVFVREKFNSFYTAFMDEAHRRSEESSEFLKKKMFKRDSVQYILDRLAEQESSSLPISCKNPFYTLGLSPKLCDSNSLKKHSRKLKTLLHPDTEHEPEWKKKAEKAFKEACLALDQCLKTIDTFSATLYRVGPAPPYLKHLNITLTDNSIYSATSQNNTTRGDKADSEQQGDFQDKAFENTFLYFPEFSIRCDDQKVGSLSVEVDLSELHDSKLWHMLGKNKAVTIFVPRPLHYEPYTVQMAPEMLSLTQRCNLTEPLINRSPILKVEAVQPIRFGTSWRYYVGLKISGDKGSTLVSWKSLYIELASRGRTINHVTKLLKTFENASFVDQGVLQQKINSVKESGSKSEGEKYLMQCTKQAQTWANEN